MAVATPGRGQRHQLKQSRWEVLACSDKFMIGRWLPADEARYALRDGFYPTGTVIRVMPSGSKRRVIRNKIILRK